MKNAGKASPEGEGNWAKSSFEDLVQYNDGFRSNLIGTPEQIAERIVGMKEAGADLVLLGFLHFQEEVEFFGRRVIPLVRELEAEAALARRRRRGGVTPRRPVRGPSALHRENEMDGAFLRAEAHVRAPAETPRARVGRGAGWPNPGSRPLALSDIDLVLRRRARR